MAFLLQGVLETDPMAKDVTVLKQEGTLLDTIRL